MKNISFFINTLSAAGGTQRVLTSLANLLVQDYKVVVIVINGDEPFFELSRKVGIHLIEPKGGSKLVKLINLNKEIYNQLKTTSCDYYISLDANSVMFQSIFLPRKTRLVVWEHFSLSKNFNKISFKLSRYYASKRVYKMILLSRQEVIDWRVNYKIPQAKLEHIYNPVTIELKDNKLQEIDFYKNKRVLAIGNNINVKGFDFLIRAWSQIKNNGWTLEIVGLPEGEQQKLKELMRKLKFENPVIIQGRISDIAAKYLKSSIYCLCSRMEATPLVLIESQYVGIPAVVFNNCEGPLELLDESGIIVEFKDVNGYSRAIQNLMDSKTLYSELSKNARLNSRRFSPSSFYNRWKEILD